MKVGFLVACKVVLARGDDAHCDRYPAHTLSTICTFFLSLYSGPAWASWCLVWTPGLVVGRDAELMLGRQEGGVLGGHIYPTIRKASVDLSFPAQKPQKPPSQGPPAPDTPSTLIRGQWGQTLQLPLGETLGASTPEGLTPAQLMLSGPLSEHCLAGWWAKLSSHSCRARGGSQGVMATSCKWKCSAKCGESLVLACPPTTTPLPEQVLQAQASAHRWVCLRLALSFAQGRVQGFTLRLKQHSLCLESPQTS